MTADIGVGHHRKVLHLAYPVQFAHATLADDSLIYIEEAQTSFRAKVVCKHSVSEVYAK